MKTKQITKELTYIWLVAFLITFHTTALGSNFTVAQTTRTVLNKHCIQSNVDESTPLTTPGQLQQQCDCCDDPLGCSALQCDDCANGGLFALLLPYYAGIIPPLHIVSSLVTTPHIDAEADTPYHPPRRLS